MEIDASIGLIFPLLVSAERRCRRTPAGPSQSSILGMPCLIKFVVVWPTAPGTEKPVLLPNKPVPATS